MQRHLAVAWLVLTLGGVAVLAQSTASLPTQNAGPGTDVVVTITLSPASGVDSMEFLLGYDPTVLRASSAYVTGYTDAFALASDLAVPGQVSLTLSSGPALAGSGPVAWISFRALSAAGTYSTLTWSACVLNGGSIPCSTVDGRVNVVASTVVISVPDGELHPPGVTAVVPISVAPATGALGIDLDLVFNPYVVQPIAVHVAGLTQAAGWSDPAWSLPQPGRLDISLFGINELEGSGPVCNVSLQVVGQVGDSTPLDLQNGRINEISRIQDDGSFVVCDLADLDDDGYAGCDGDCDNSLDSVYPGAPDAACDGTDNDCDGDADDEYVPEPTACGIGACANTGYIVCEAGQEQDDCVPGSPASESCNDVDDDCDGTVDNAAVPAGSSQLDVSLDGTATQLGWGALADATAYDVVQGSVASLLASGGFDAATEACIADDTTATTASDDASPDPGDAAWFLVRGINCGGPGTYGSAARDAGIALSPNACP